MLGSLSSGPPVARPGPLKWFVPRQRRCGRLRGTHPKLGQVEQLEGCGLLVQQPLPLLEVAVRRARAEEEVAQSWQGREVVL